MADEEALPEGDDPQEWRIGPDRPLTRPRPARTSVGEVKPQAKPKPPQLPQTEPRLRKQVNGGADREAEARGGALAVDAGGDARCSHKRKHSPAPKAASASKAAAVEVQRSDGGKAAARSPAPQAASGPSAPRAIGSSKKGAAVAGPSAAGASARAKPAREPQQTAGRAGAAKGGGSKAAVGSRMTVIEREWWEGVNEAPSPSMVDRWLVAHYFAGDEQLEYSGQVRAFKLEDGTHRALVSFDGGEDEWVDLARVEWHWLDEEEASRRQRSAEWIALVHAVRDARLRAPSAAGGEAGAGTKGSGALCVALATLLRTVTETTASHYACLVADGVPLLLDVAASNEHGGAPRLALRCLGALLLTSGCRLSLYSDPRALALLLRKADVLLGAPAHADFLPALCDLLSCLHNLAIDPASHPRLIEAGVLERTSRCLSLQQTLPRVCALNLLHNLSLGLAGVRQRICAHADGVLLAKVLQQLEGEEGGGSCRQGGALSMAGAPQPHQHHHPLQQQMQQWQAQQGPPPQAPQAPQQRIPTDRAPLLEREDAGSPRNVVRRACALVLALSAGADQCLAMVDQGLLRYVAELVQSEDAAICQLALATLHNVCSPRLAGRPNCARPDPRLVCAAMDLTSCHDALVAETAIQAVCQVAAYAPSRELAAQLGFAPFFAQLATSADSALLRGSCQRVTREKVAHAIRLLPSLCAPAGIDQASARALQHVLAADGASALSVLDAQIARSKKAHAAKGPGGGGDDGGGGGGKGKHKASLAPTGGLVPAYPVRSPAHAQHVAVGYAIGGSAFDGAEPDGGLRLDFGMALRPPDDDLGEGDGAGSVGAHDPSAEPWGLRIRPDDSAHGNGWARSAPDVMQLAAGSDSLGLDLGLGLTGDPFG